MLKRICQECGKKINLKSDTCPHCGVHRYGKDGEYKPTEEHMKLAANILGVNLTHREQERKGFSDEEILALGLYPKDEGYKMSLISKILNK